MSGSKAPWLDYLADKIGEREIPGPQHNPLIVEWGKQSGIDWWNNDEDAWCAVAVNGALVNSGHPSTRSALARSFTTYGTRLAKPIRGAIVVFPRGTNPLYGHVGIVDEVRADGTIVVINGNVGDMVKRSVFRTSAILPDGIRWPPGDAPAEGAPSPAPTLGTRTLRRGDRGDDVAELQSDLNRLGYAAGAADGIFGPDTEDAVRDFQRAADLAIDGIAGPATLSALDRETADKLIAEAAKDTATAAAKPAAVTAAGAAATATAVAGAARDVGGLWDGTALGLAFVALLAAAALGYLAYRYFTDRAAREAAQ
ncbi:PG-binding 1, multi-domain protein [Stappia sp. 22II-S9-Z10]|nr:PG-binding 1, multi-domain protein [Stappia sp. 22II-S9-Z10]